MPLLAAHWAGRVPGKIRIVRVVHAVAWCCMSDLPSGDEYEALVEQLMSQLVETISVNTERLERPAERLRGASGTTHQIDVLWDFTLPNGERWRLLFEGALMEQHAENKVRCSPTTALCRTSLEPLIDSVSVSWSRRPATKRAPTSLGRARTSCFWNCASPLMRTLLTVSCR